ncbi:cell envelope integrity protein CreD [Mucilaginibacter sp. BT774]|uniref:cell envelope integrity protein CreD n=1 Tax=Mucilaginibacter sp. BT774 TaxID=3062276 RepID=UPI0026771FCC|nr:cell envelope integrity protein CreD [Mucilaginibacter sp. BT774]MDO3625553.1 cell envelope integrity protein CreD [Mucilaginibacter sp. BT774]
MMTEQPQPQGFLYWLKESVTVKLAFIGLLVILLLIPSTLVQNLIQERSLRQDETEKQVSDQYSGEQLVQGPVLVIPYKKQIKETDNSGREVTKEVTNNLFLLPNELDYNANVSPDILHRGIFEVVVYNGTIKVSGNFTKVDLSALSITTDQLMPEKAKLMFSISDLKGLKTNPQLKIAGQTATAEPAFGDTVFSNGLQVAVNLAGMMDKTISFEFDLDLKGSNELSFLHLGKTTDVTVKGNWGSPSFDGRYLPDTRKIDTKANTFDAKWRMLYYNRPFPQQWVDDLNVLKTKKADDATFGVKLRLPVDQYQKTTRSSKYAILIIMLTFISLFLTEMISKHRIHVFNYVLIGAAMIVYYTLLLSFSEQVGFTFAYLIASAATVILVAAFLKSLIKSMKTTGLFGLILSLFYAFIYVIIQLEDLALLVGSVALFLVVATLMYFSRKINWQ